MNNVYMGLDVEDFIFGEGTTYAEETIDNVSEEEMNAFGVIECTEDPDVACYRIALENEQNHNAIMMAMLTREYNVLESTGQVMVYEAVNVKKYIELIKAQIQKWWAKIQGVFKKVMDQITSFTGSNKAFVKRFRSRAGEMKVAKDKFNFTGYEFTGKRVSYSAVSAYLAEGNDFAKYTAAEQKETTLNVVRGKLLGESGIGAGEFSKKLTNFFYANEGHTKTIEVGKLSFTDLLDELENAPTAKKDVKAAHAEVKKTVKQMLSATNKAKADVEGDELKGLKNWSSILSQSLTIMSTVCNAEVRAITAKMIQDRKAANAIVSANNKKDGVHESTSETPEIDVVLI